MAGLTKKIIDYLKKYGKSKNDNDDRFDPRELKMGIEVELEHTPSREVAKQIAKDHLIEIPDYYTRLKNMEKEAGIEENKVELYNRAGENDTEADNARMNKKIIDDVEKMLLKKAIRKDDQYIIKGSDWKKFWNHFSKEVKNEIEAEENEEIPKEYNSP